MKRSATAAVRFVGCGDLPPRIPRNIPRSNPSSPGSLLRAQPGARGRADPPGT